MPPPLPSVGDPSGLRELSARELSVWNPLSVGARTMEGEATEPVDSGSGIRDQDA